MKWFNNPQTLEELKKQYKRLAMKHHPDIGGNVRDMQEINAEYDHLFEVLKNTHQMVIFPFSIDKSKAANYNIYITIKSDARD